MVRTNAQYPTINLIPRMGRVSTRDRVFVAAFFVGGLALAMAGDSLRMGETAFKPDELWK